MSLFKKGITEPKTKGKKCPFAFAAMRDDVKRSAVTLANIIDNGVNCGDWCKLYDPEKDECKLALRNL